MAECIAQNDGKEAKPSFIELIAPPTSAGRECILELEGARGKLRLELKGLATEEVAGISRALWEIVVLGNSATSFPGTFDTLEIPIQRCRDGLAAVYRGRSCR